MKCHRPVGMARGVAPMVSTIGIVANGVDLWSLPVVDSNKGAEGNEGDGWMSVRRD